MISEQRGRKTIKSVTNILFQRLLPTCVSYMEQNRAGREAEVGDVCAELQPLQTRAGIKDNVIFIRCEGHKQKG